MSVQHSIGTDLRKTVRGFVHFERRRPNDRADERMEYPRPSRGSRERRKLPKWCAHVFADFVAIEVGNYVLI